MGVQGAEPMQGECSLRVWGHLVYRKVSHDHTRLQKGLFIHICVWGHLLTSQQVPGHSRCCRDTGVSGEGGRLHPPQGQAALYFAAFATLLSRDCKVDSQQGKAPQGNRGQGGWETQCTHFPQGEQEEFAKAAGVPATWTGIQLCQHQHLTFIW